MQYCSSFSTTSRHVTHHGSSTKTNNVHFHNSLRVDLQIEDCSNKELFLIDVKTPCDNSSSMEKANRLNIEKYSGVKWRINYLHGLCTWTHLSSAVLVAGLTIQGFRLIFEFVNPIFENNKFIFKNANLIFEITKSFFWNLKVFWKLAVNWFENCVFIFT